MFEKIDPQILRSVSQVFDALMACDNHEFGELIEGLGREAVLVRVGEGAPIPEDFERAVDRTAREVVEAYNAPEHAYRERF